MCVRERVYGCLCVRLLNCTKPRYTALSSLSFNATRIGSSKRVSMILTTKTFDQTRERGHNLALHFLLKP